MLGALIFILAGMQAAFDSRPVWERIRWAEDGARRSAASDPVVPEETS
jgi:hypothetical protein